MTISSPDSIRQQGCERRKREERCEVWKFCQTRAWRSDSCLEAYAGDLFPPGIGMKLITDTEVTNIMKHLHF